MTRRDYPYLANAMRLPSIIREETDRTQRELMTLGWKATVLSVAEKLQQDNRAFDASWFLRDAGLPELPELGDKPDAARS